MMVNRNHGCSADPRQFWNRLRLGAYFGCFSIVLLSGCAPPTSGDSADEQERHFVLGENRIDAMDYQGAIQAFEESLNVDPHSAPAHFQLGWLYDSKVPDPAAAIYHYEKYLELEPDAGNALVVKQRIEACKQTLAAGVWGLPSMPAAQQRIEQLLAQNRQLQDKNRRLQEKIQQLQAGLNRWSNYCARRLTTRTDSTAPPPGTAQPAPVAALTKPAVARSDGFANPAPSRPAAWRKHTVVAGETAVHIARGYGISLGVLLAANPGLEPRQMPVGLILNVPPPHSY